MRRIIAACAAVVTLGIGLTGCTKDDQVGPFGKDSAGSSASSSAPPEADSSSAPNVPSDVTITAQSDEQAAQLLGILHARGITYLDDELDLVTSASVGKWTCDMLRYEHMSVSEVVGFSSDGPYLKPGDGAIVTLALIEVYCPEFKDAP